MRVLLAALTGMGNAVLKALRSMPEVEALLVVTRAESGPFPHYPCPHLAEVCAGLGQHHSTEAHLDTPQGLELARAFAPDLILTATYHRIVPAEIISLARWAVNIHPSLLPAYKGPTPTNWAVAHGERESGLSYHLLDAKIDSGDLLMQYRAAIDGMTDGEARQTLYGLAGETIPELIRTLASGSCKPAPLPPGGTTHPRFASPQGVALMQGGSFRRGDLIRAATPYPGTEFLKSHGI